MGRFKTSHLVEAGLWLTFVAIFFGYSFQFDREIEIYRYGAASWPRVILILIALAAIGQLLWQSRQPKNPALPDNTTTNDDAGNRVDISSAHAEDHAPLQPTWYLWTLALLAIPFVYMNLPNWIVKHFAIPEDDIGPVKIATAGILIVLYLLLAWKNHLGAILALPIFFASLLEDMGFYALAPAFIIGIMFLMGERRISRMAAITVLIYGLLLMFFVKLLYVGLPTGYVKPFYDFGNWVVALLQ